jgi:hypothetical protein
MDDLMIMLNHFYDDNVKMSRRETKRNVGIVMPLINGILTYVHQRDERFKMQPLNVGSYYSHLKVSRADEFDYSVVLDTPSYVWDSAVYTPAYYEFDENKQQVVKSSLSLPSPPVGKCVIPENGLIKKWDQKRLNEGQSCLTVDDHLIPFNVKRRFKQLVSEAVNQLGIQRFVDAKRLSESPAATLSISHPNIVEEYCVSVDLAPLVETHLPFIQKFGWPRSSARWPSRSKIDQIKATGIHTVATDKLYWKFSFVSCEKELLKEIDINGTCRKKTQRIMKKLKESWCPKGKKQELTSYHLKNILFWECEYHPHDSEWTDDKLAIRIVSMCSLLVDRILDGNLPLYFHIRVNLFASKDMDELRRVGCKIREFLQYPQKYLC